VASSKSSIAIYCAEPTRRHDAANLAARLSLPLVTATDAQYDLLLSLTSERLELRQTDSDAPGPVYAEFASGSFGYRLARGGSRREPLARAIGLRGSTKPTVLDATAGLGRDAFMLAVLGCQVTIIERSPVIHALLGDGLERAHGNPRLSTALKRLSLHRRDSIHYLEHLPRRNAPDVIYLDPMYPHGDRSALNKKEMRLLRQIVGNDKDAVDLLAVALTRARRRVVVKRPRLAPGLQGAPPTVQIKGSTTRYDVYATALHRSTTA
jgi:16S rRNA (guanine1516-N2)-methyltransferase